MLLHRLEQRGLRLGRRAVDLVGQNHVREHGAANEAEEALARLAVLFHHVGARDVRRHQIRGELNALELKLEQLGERADEQRLGQTGYADKQGVAATEYSGKHLLDHLLLPDDHAAELASHLHISLIQSLNQRDIVVGQLGHFVLHERKISGSFKEFL